MKVGATKSSEADLDDHIVFCPHLVLKKFHLFYHFIIRNLNVGGGEWWRCSPPVLEAPPS